MREEQIYINWPFRVRYLKQSCWEQLKALIIDHEITSVLEFGSGISTILFNNLGLDVISYETDPVYLRKVKSFNLANVDFRLWDNITAKIKGTFGLSLIDGILPRTNQLSYAQKHSRYIAVDDFDDEETSKPLISMLKNYTRLDDKSTRLAIFRML